jgi:transcription elongation GreA/GreB family factor
MSQPSNPEIIILSTVSAWNLGEQFETTVAKKNEALREAKIAKQDGDLSENAPYQAAKDKFRTMGRIQRRLTKEMNVLLKQGHKLVDPLTWANDKPVSEAEIGVVAVIERWGERDTYLIAGSRDHHVPEEGEVAPIPYSSPLGKAITGHKPGDCFTVQINGRDQEIKMIEIRRPTREEILNVFPQLREELA